MWLDDPVLRGLLAGAALTILLQIIVRKQKWLEANKWPLRISTVLIVGLAIAIEDFAPDGAMSWEADLRLWFSTLAAAQFEYSWIMKYVADKVPAVDRH